MVFVSINSNNAEFIPTEEDFARYELLKKKDWVSLTEDERCFMGRVLIYINRQNAESFEELDEAIDSGDKCVNVCVAIIHVILRDGWRM